MKLAIDRVAESSKTLGYSVDVDVVSSQIKIKAIKNSQENRILVSVS